MPIVPIRERGNAFQHDVGATPSQHDDDDGGWLALFRFGRVFNFNIKVLNLGNARLKGEREPCVSVGRSDFAIS